MRIVQIGPYPFNNKLPMGGVEASVFGLSHELAKENLVFVLDIPRNFLKKDEIESEDNIEIFRFFLKGKSNIFSILRLNKVLKSIIFLKPDIAHVHTTGFYSLFLYLLLKFYLIPVIVTVHGLIHLEKRSQWLREKTFHNLVKYIFKSLTEFFFLNICKKIIVDTQYVANTLTIYKKQNKILRLPDCKVIPQGIQSDFFKLKNEGKINQFLSVGAFTQRKGHLYLIDSMMKIRTQNNNFSLIITGALSDINYFRMVQNKIFENGLENNIRLIPNSSFDELKKLFESSGIFVLHSEEESQGIVFCEAMAAGIPIIATKSGGIPWIVEHGENGLLSDFGNINCFTNNILKLMLDNELYKTIVNNNKVKSQKYNWKTISKDILNIYKTYLSN